MRRQQIKREYLSCGIADPGSPQVEKCADLLIEDDLRTADVLHVASQMSF
jgi:hypothetical protein